MGIGDLKGYRRYQQFSNVTDTQNSRAGKTARLTLIAGVWHADGIRCNNYREALGKTLGAVGLHGTPKPVKIPKAGTPRRSPARLESRPWWPQFLKDHGAREQARADRREALREYRRLGLAPKGTKASPTLRERFLAKAAKA